MISGGDPLTAFGSFSEMLAASTKSNEPSPDCGMVSDEARTPVSAPHPPAGRFLTVTNALVALNFVTFALTVIVQRIWPHLDLLHRGSNFGPLSLSRECWRLLTSTFLHVSVGHLLGNILFLWIFGRRLEQSLGKWAFLTFYVTCGIAGNIAGIAYAPETETCGASPGVFGLAGGLISTYSLKGLPAFKNPRFTLALLILWTVYSIYPDTGTAKLTVVLHTAGLVTGLGLGAILASRFSETHLFRVYVFFGAAFLLLLSVISVRRYNNYLIPLACAIRASEAGRTDDALGKLRFTLKERPNSLFANILATKVYLSEEDYPDAEATARHALAIDHGDERATFLFGLVKLHTGYCDEAHEIGDKVFVHSRDENLKHQAWSLSIAACDDAGSGDRFLSEGRADLAIGFYRSALHNNPKDYRAESGLSKAYRAKGMQREAAEAAAKAAAMQAGGQH
jgi:membrane associated rhomboid family serine protease